VELRPPGTPASIAGLGFTAEDHDYFTTPETMLGTVTEITPVAAGYALTLSITSPSPPWDDMVGGRIAVGGGTWVEVVAANDVASTVTISLLSIPFSIHDDDVDALLPYSTMTLHPLYQAAYQDAYIEPVLISAADSELLAWQLNVLSEQLGTFVESEFDAHRGDGFWVAYIMWMFQFHEQMDYDAATEIPTLALGTGRGWTIDDKYSGLALESTRDSFAIQPLRFQGFGYQTDTDLLWRTTAHEVGHQFALDHSNVRLMGSAEATGSARFDPADLEKIRSQAASPGLR